MKTFDYVVVVEPMPLPENLDYHTHLRSHFPRLRFVTGFSLWRVQTCTVEGRYDLCFPREELRVATKKEVEGYKWFFEPPDFEVWDD
jgi:hypothetical protein